MRLGMIAPIWESTPPSGYGGIERIVDLLVRRLVELGHAVTLFATGDSRSPAPCVWTEPAALRTLGLDTYSNQNAELVHVTNAIARHAEFDVFHNHTGLVGIALATATGAPMLTTLHGPLLPDNVAYYRAFARHPYVSISHSQRDGAPDLRYVGNVYNAIETATYGIGQREDYLLFLGRISPEKGTHLAIEVARQAGMPLVIAAKVDPYDQEYYEQAIVPHLDGHQVRFIGEVGGSRKREVLQGARALLHMVQWPEPFGLVMIEALASGTPVIAMRRGSIPEVVADGRTGFTVESVEEAVGAIAHLDAIDPAECRRDAVARFDVSRMVDEYLALYEQVAAGVPRPFARP